MRLNTKDGRYDVISANQTDWIHHPSSDDVAIFPLGLSEKFLFSFVLDDMFISHDVISQYNIGPGDDVFIVGRFVNHEGKQRNIPSLRFGNISMMPWEPIKHPTRGILMESFLVEARSISGYSGSPVFVYIPPFARRPERTSINSQAYGPWLLGIDWGHIPVKEVVKEKAAPGEDEREVPEGWWVRYNAGMMGVLPAWKLLELLNTDDVRISRERAEIELGRTKEKNDT